MAKYDTERVPKERPERTRVREEFILKRCRHKMSTHPAFSARATGNHAHQRTWSPQNVKGHLALESPCKLR